MGAWVNRRSTNIVGIAIIAFITIAAAAYGIDAFLTSIHAISA
jgi:hypothetical protein